MHFTNKKHKAQSNLPSSTAAQHCGELQTIVLAAQLKKLCGTTFKLPRASFFSASCSLKQFVNICSCLYLVSRLFAEVCEV